MIFSQDNIEQPETRHFDETDTWGERWDNFEDMVSDFDPVPEGMEGIWMESDLRQRTLEMVRKHLEKEGKSPFGDDEELLEGLKSALGYFSFVQLEELSRLVEKTEEGVAEERQQEKFEKSSKTEERD